MQQKARTEQRTAFGQVTDMKLAMFHFLKLVTKATQSYAFCTCNMVTILGTPTLARVGTPRSWSLTMHALACSDLRQTLHAIRHFSVFFLKQLEAFDDKLLSDPLLH